MPGMIPFHIMQLDDQKREFEARGLVKLDGLIPDSWAAAARDLIHNVASAHDLYKSGEWKRSESRFSDAKSFRSAINALNHADHFPKLVSDQVIDIAQNLLGKPVVPLAPGQQILFTLPGGASWSVPNDVWHIDIPRLGKLGPPGVQMFTFLEDVEPRGGGTLVLSGSHRLMNTSRVLRSKELKRVLGKASYFRSLFDHKRAPIRQLEETAGKVDGVDLQIVELTGRKGDVYFMDLRALHTPAPNCSKTARLMLTCRLPRAAVASVCMNPDAG